MELKATFNNIVVLPQEEEEKTFGNIIVPDLGKEVGLRGTITSVGPGGYSVTGNLIPTSLKVGQKVILPPVGPTKVEHGGKEYWICNEQQVLAIIE